MSPSGRRDNETQQHFWFLPACSAMTLLAGCATGPSKPVASRPRTHVNYHVVSAQADRRYVVPAGTTSSYPTLVKDPAPTYPPGMIPLHLPHVSVRARLIVGAHGRLREARITPARRNRAHAAAFGEAVALALLGWRYTPLQFSRWRDQLDAHGNVVGSQQVVVASRPFSLDYVFDFELHDGKPIVNTLTSATK